MALSKEKKARLTEIINEAFEKLVEEEIVPEDKVSRIVSIVLPAIRAFLIGK